MAASSGVQPEATRACEIYIPDRLSEGYGLNLSAIDMLAEQGVTLIITVD